MIQKCPFECTTFKPCPSDQLLHHVQTECNGKELCCKNQDCGIDVFKEYDKQQPLHPSGQHECTRDNKAIRIREAKENAELKAKQERDAQIIAEKAELEQKLEKYAQKTCELKRALQKAEQENEAMKARLNTRERRRE